MKVLIINPWPYTVEPGKPVHKVDDLDDTMIVGLATAFSKICETTLYIDEKYKPIRGGTIRLI